MSLAPIVNMNSNFNSNGVFDKFSSLYKQLNIISIKKFCFLNIYLCVFVCIEMPWKNSVTNITLMSNLHLMVEKICIQLKR